MFSYLSRESTEFVFTQIYMNMCFYFSHCQRSVIVFMVESRTFLNPQPSFSPLPPLC